MGGICSHSTNTMVASNSMAAVLPVTRHVEQQRRKSLTVDKTSEMPVRQKTTAMDDSAVERLRTGNMLKEARSLTTQERQTWWVEHKPSWYIPHTKDVSTEDVHVCRGTIALLAKRNSSGFAMIVKHFPTETPMSFFFDRFWMYMCIMHEDAIGLGTLSMDAKASYLASILKGSLHIYAACGSAAKRLAARTKQAQKWRSARLDLPTAVHSISAVMRAMQQCLDTEMGVHRQEAFKRVLSFTIGGLMDVLQFTTHFQQLQMGKSSHDVAWTAEQASGVEQLDSDHELIFSIVNGLGKQLFEKKVPDFFAIDVALTCLVQSCIIHYHHESALWQKYEYTEDTEEHERQHQAFLDTAIAQQSDWTKVYLEYRRRQRSCNSPTAARSAGAGARARGGNEKLLGVLERRASTVTPSSPSASPGLPPMPPMPSSLAERADVNNENDDEDDDDHAELTRHMTHVVTLREQGDDRVPEVAPPTVQQMYDALDLHKFWRSVKTFLEEHEIEQDSKFNQFLAAKGVNVTWSGVQVSRARGSLAPPAFIGQQSTSERLSERRRSSALSSKRREYVESEDSEEADLLSSLIKKKATP